MNDCRDEFLSEEDLDWKNLSLEEIIRYGDNWLRQAHATNAFDKEEYSHGVFMWLNRDFPADLGYY